MSSPAIAYDLALMPVQFLRIYKHGSSSYVDITSATVGGFADLVRTQVHNDAGSLAFTLAGTTPAVFGAWIDEAATVEYWEDGAKVGTYYVDEYTPHLADLRCEVRCVGILAEGLPPGLQYSGPIAPDGSAGKDLVANVLRDVVRAGTQDPATTTMHYATWVWDPAKVFTPLGILYVDDFRHADGRYNGGDGGWWRTDDPLAAPWHTTGIGAAPYVTGGALYTWLSGAQEWSAYNDGFTARADMHVQATCEDAPSATSLIGLLARYVSASASYLAGFSDTAVGFYRRNGSTWTGIGSPVAITGPVKGDIIGFSTIGTALTAYVNGIQVASATDTAITSAGYAGARGYGTTGSTSPAIGNFAVTDGARPALALGASYTRTPSADAIKELCQMAGYTFWFDVSRKLNVEPYRVQVDKTYPVSGALHDFETSYSARDIINAITIVNDQVTGVWSFSNAASITAFGLKSREITSTTIVNEAQAERYALAYFAQHAQPRRSADLSVDHDATLRPGLKVAVTGLEDGRTYEDLIQQVTYRLGDLWDSVQTGTPALTLGD